MDLLITGDEQKQTTFTHKIVRCVLGVCCCITIVAGGIYGVLGWQDYSAAPHGGYTLVQNPDGSDLGYLDPGSGRLIAGAPPSHIRDFIEQAKRSLSISTASEQPVSPSHAMPAAHATNSSQPPAHAGAIPLDMLGRYQSGDYELRISHAAGSAKGAVNLSLLAQDAEVWSATATRVGDDIRFYRDQTHDCPMMISRLTGRLAFFTVGAAKHCGDLSMTGFYYAP